MDDANCTCADRAKRAALTLKVIVRNGIADVDAMEMISTLVDDAGVKAATDAVSDPVPF